VAVPVAIRALVPWAEHNRKNLTIYIAITIIIFIFMSRCFWSLVKHSTCHTFSGIFADEGFEIFANVHWLVLGLFNYFSMLWSPFISFHIFYLKTLDGLQDLVTKHRLIPPTKFRTKFFISFFCAILKDLLFSNKINEK